VDLVLLEGMRDLVTEVQMQFLEIYSNLVSSNCVKMLNGALHYSTGTERGLDIGFSSCTAPTLYSCLSISGVFWGL